MARQVFYSFHYRNDYWRAATVRSIGVIEGNRPAHDNDWEAIVNQGDEAIERWIKEQMQYKSCTVVLVGSYTANRKWIDYEIIEAWNRGMGVVGIRIHGLKDSKGYTSLPGDNPFENITFKSTNEPLSSVVKCYNPAGITSKERYDWIAKHLANAVAEATRIRTEY
jgi:hypothetical protein